MQLKLPEEIIKMMDQYIQAGFQIYLVGGGVRNLLLDRPITNPDFTTDAKPEEILQLFPEGFYDNKFGTVGIPLNDQIYEVTTMRKEGIYQDSRHPAEVAWTNKLAEDLARRELTVSAIAMDKEGNITDPYHGLDDLHKKIIRSVGDPKQRFQEDALRLMRAIRISTQLGFEIEINTWQAIRENAGLITNIAWERIRDELLKILESPNPYIGIIKLRESGILQIILPELERTFGIVQTGPKHARVYDIGEHSLQTLIHTPSPDPIVRLAALLHDIGKVNTFRTDENGNVTFYNHDLVGGKLILAIVKRFNLSKKQSDKLYRLVRWHLFSVNEFQTDSAIRRFIKNVGLENVEDMLALRVGDRLGGGTQRAVSWRMETFKERIKKVLEKPFTVADLKVNGHDVMEILQIPSSPKVGEILNKLFEEVLEDSSKNNREYLLARIKSIEV